jgi:hypothetical protein
MGGWTLAPIMEEPSHGCGEGGPHQLKPRATESAHAHCQANQADCSEHQIISPILIDGADGIIAGHGKAEAAKQGLAKCSTANLRWLPVK